jgi:hypothetical protein
MRKMEKVGFTLFPVTEESSKRALTLLKYTPDPLFEALLLSMFEPVTKVLVVSTITSAYVYSPPP